LRIGWVGRGFWGAKRGELMVNRGNWCGSYVVIFVVNEYANFSKYILVG
jgi:hypothetical protein